MYVYTDPGVPSLFQMRRSQLLTINKKNLSPVLRQNVSLMHPGDRKMKRKCIDE